MHLGRGALAGGLLVPRLAGLGLSLWEDEIRSVRGLRGGGPSTIFGRYDTNDQMLLSFLG
jgi:hypothetical protein